MAAPRPQPRFPEPDTQPFWEATKRHELTYQTCNECNTVIFYPTSTLHQLRLTRDYLAGVQR